MDLPPSTSKDSSFSKSFSSVAEPDPPSNEQRGQKRKRSPRLVKDNEEILDILREDTPSVFEGLLEYSSEEWQPDGDSDDQDSDDADEGADNAEVTLEPLPEPDEVDDDPLFSSPSTSVMWMNDQHPRQDIPFSGHSGLLVDIPGTEPIDFFRLFAHEHFFQYLQKEMNEYGPTIFHDKWVDVDLAELQKFLSLLYLIGHIKVPQFKLLWANDDLYNFPNFPAVMTRDRFATLLRAFHFAPNPASGEKPKDPLYKIRPLHEMFRNTVKEVYYPFKNLSLDESLVAWRGRLFFRQYIKGKRHKYGVKLYLLCEPNGFVLNSIIYSGSRDPEVGGVGHTEKVVHRLLSDFTDKGHAVFMNNYYNSPKLSRELLKKVIYSTGTLRSNRKDIPNEVVSKKLKKGEICSKFSPDGLCVMKWKDKRDVLSISSEFGDETVQHTDKYGNAKRIPKQIAEYNEYMAGVDRCDQLVSYYNNDSRTMRWYIRLAMHYLQIIMNNAHILYNKYSGKKMPLFDFRNSVIRSLKGPIVERPRRKTKEHHIHLPMPLPKTDKGRTKRKMCTICSKKGIRKDVSLYCDDCEGKPGLCLTPCFREHHKYL